MFFNGVLIKTMGLIGAGIATVIGQGVVFLFLFLSKKTKWIPLSLVGLEKK